MSSPYRSYGKRSLYPCHLLWKCSLLWSYLCIKPSFSKIIPIIFYFHWQYIYRFKIIRINSNKYYLSLQKWIKMLQTPRSLPNEKCLIVPMSCLRNHEIKFSLYFPSWTSFGNYQLCTTHYVSFESNWST